jgi:hypothetical protein
MMMLPEAGERALRVLEHDMPWLADRAVPTAPDAFMVGLKPSGEYVAIVHDEANDTVRELRIDKSAIDQPARIAFGVERALTAPWN